MNDCRHIQGLTVWENERTDLVQCRCDTCPARSGEFETVREAIKDFRRQYPTAKTTMAATA